MKILYIFLFAVFFISCGKKTDIKVPVNDNPGLHEIWNNSPVYILFKTEGNDTIADLKIGQTISSTDWLVAIDRRLTMKKLVGPIEKILKKRHKKSIHSDGTNKAYFTYMDSIQKKVSFVSFDSIELMPSIYTSQTYYKKYFKTEENYNKTHIIVNKEGIIINDTIQLKEPVDKQLLLNTYLRHIVHRMKEKPNRVYLNFDLDLDYNRFLNYYTFFKNNPPPKGDISQRIFIFE